VASALRQLLPWLHERHIFHVCRRRRSLMTVAPPPFYNVAHRLSGKRKEGGAGCVCVCVCVCVLFLSGKRKSVFWCRGLPHVLTALFSFFLDVALLGRGLEQIDTTRCSASYLRWRPVRRAGQTGARAGPRPGSSLSISWAGHFRIMCSKVVFAGARRSACMPPWLGACLGGVMQGTEGHAHSRNSRI
jgi:hypothetical protein